MERSSFSHTVFQMPPLSYPLHFWGKQGGCQDIFSKDISKGESEVRNMEVEKRLKSHCPGTELGTPTTIYQ